MFKGATFSNPSFLHRFLLLWMKPLSAQNPISKNLDFNRGTRRWNSYHVEAWRWPNGVHPLGWWNSWPPSSCNNQPGANTSPPIYSMGTAWGARKKNDHESLFIGTFVRYIVYTLGLNKHITRFLTEGYHHHWPILKGIYKVMGYHTGKAPNRRGLNLLCRYSSIFTNQVPNHSFI